VSATPDGTQLTWVPTSERAIAAGAQPGAVAYVAAVVTQPESIAPVAPVAAAPVAAAPVAAAPVAAAPVAAAPVAAAPETNTQPSPVGTPAPTGTAEKRKAGDKIQLFINCIPLRGFPGSGAKAPQDAAKVFENLKAQIAAHYGAEHFYLLDAFKRRDAVNSCISAVVEQELLGSCIYATLVSSAGEDYNNFIKALQPHADVVVIGTN